MADEEVATDKQVAYVRGLLKDKHIPDEVRTLADRLLDRTLSKGEAKTLIPLLKSLPWRYEKAPAGLLLEQKAALAELRKGLVGKTLSELSGDSKVEPDFTYEVASKKPPTHDIRLALAKVINESDGAWVPVSSLREIIAAANQAEFEGATVSD